MTPQATILALTVGSSLCIAGMWWCERMLRRNDRIAAFLYELIDLCGAYNDRAIHYTRKQNNEMYQKTINNVITLEQYKAYCSVAGFESAYIWFYDNQVPTYGRLMWSFKPLTLEAWFTPELIDRLLNEYKHEQN